jgi:hypothetical protein
MVKASNSDGSSLLVEEEAIQAISTIQLDGVLLAANRDAFLRLENAE